MSLTKQECKLLRALVNRALLGPAWFNETPSSPELRALVAELRNQTREWLMANVVRELNAMLPADERVTVAGMLALQLQAPSHTPATAADPAQETRSGPGRSSELAPHQAVFETASQADARYRGLAPEPAPPAPRATRNPRDIALEDKGLYCPFGLRQCTYPDCGCHGDR